MDIFTATMIAEGAEPADPERQREAWQLLVNTGVAWQLQGWFGRMAQAMIAAGDVEPAPRVHHGAAAKRVFENPQRWM